MSASTQNQALSAILFLCQHVLGQSLLWLDGIVRAQRPQRLPVVLKDLNFHRGELTVRDGKGGKDRVTQPGYRPGRPCAPATGD